MINKKTGISFTATLAIGLVASLAGKPTYGQVYGCTDKLADNYSVAATVNDGSCTYSLTNYTPPIKVDPISDILVEGSGLQMAGNFLWSFNDGGGAAAIYRIDTITKNILQTVSLAGAENIDWEDIAFDGTSFYIGDFGNNKDGARTDLKIYKFPFSAITDYGSNPVVIIPAGQIDIINFSYSDQPKPPVKTTGANSTKFDCEAMIVDNGKIHLFSKNWIDLNTTHYEINGLTAGTYIATPLEILATNYVVTGADKANGQKIVALLGYQNALPLNHYIYLLTDYDSGHYFNGNKRRIDLPNISVMGQAEGICFRTGTYGYISNEKIAVINQKLRSFDISNFVSDLTATYKFTGDGNWDVQANWSNDLLPPVPLNPGSEIIIDPPPGGKCVLNIPYTVPPGAKLTVNTAKNFVIQGNLTME